MSNLVSIIIPSFDRSQLLGATLDSILGQTYSHWECIVVDDGSGDYTPELMEFYCELDSRVKYYQRPSAYPKGANTCRNYGFEKSEGEYIQWFDSDDVMLKDFLELKIEKFKKEIQFVICSGYYTDEILKNHLAIPLCKRNGLYKSYVLWQNRIFTPSLLFRREFLLRNKLFDENLLRSQEFEFFSRLFYEIPEREYVLLEEPPLFLYRQHRDTKTQKNRSYVKSYRVSNTYVGFENLKRALQLKDADLLQHNYRLLMENFLHALENEHRSLAVEILEKLIPLLKTKNPRKAAELFIFGKALLVLNSRVYRIEKRIRNYTLNC